MSDFAIAAREAQPVVPYLDDPTSLTVGLEATRHTTVTQEGSPLAARPLTDDPTIEGRSLRGMWFGLLIAIPFWLLIGALIVTAIYRLR